MEDLEWKRRGRSGSDFWHILAMALSLFAGFAWKELSLKLHAVGLGGVGDCVTVRMAKDVM